MTDNSIPPSFTFQRQEPSPSAFALPGTPWTMSLWDGSRPLAIIPLEVLQDLGQQLIVKGASPVPAPVLGIIRAFKIHSPQGAEHGPFPCCLTSEQKTNPRALSWGSVVVTPGNAINVGPVAISWAEPR